MEHQVQSYCDKVTESGGTYIRIYCYHLSIKTEDMILDQMNSEKLNDKTRKIVTTNSKTVKDLTKNNTGET